MCPDAEALTMKLFSTGGLSICLLAKQRRDLDHSSELLNLLIRFPYHVLPGSIQANVVQSLPPEHAQMHPLGKNAWETAGMLPVGHKALLMTHHCHLPGLPGQNITLQAVPLSGSPGSRKEISTPEG